MADLKAPCFQQALTVLRGGRSVDGNEAARSALGPVLTTILSSEAAEIFEPLIASGKVDELADQKRGAGAGLEIPAKDYLKAMRIRRLMKQEFAKMFIDLDLLVAPSRPGPATKLTDPLDRRTLPTPVPKSPGMTSLIPAGNLAGLPAIGLPCGFADKLPVAIQLVGPPYSENVLVAVGKAFQERTDWHASIRRGMTTRVVGGRSILGANLKNNDAHFTTYT